MDENYLPQILSEMPALYSVRKVAASYARQVIFYFLTIILTEQFSLCEYHHPL